MDYKKAREIVEGKDLTDVDKCTFLGKGMNKVCYRIKLYNKWVVLAVKEKNTRIIKDMNTELSQLIHLRKNKVLVPDIGTPLQEESNAKSYFIKVKLGGTGAIGFLQEFIPGIEMKKSDMMAFWGVIYDKTKNNEKNREIALKDIKMIQSYMEQESKQIPDFQVKFNQENGHVYVIDPGNENTSGNYLDKQKKVLKYWIEKLGPPKKLW